MFFLRYKKFFLSIIFLLVALFICIYAFASEKTSAAPKLIVFFSPGCHKCIEAENVIIPEIEKDFSGRIEIEYRDINNLENYKYLLALQEKYRTNIEIELPIFFFEGKFLNGKGEIRNKLKSLITRSLTKAQGEGEIPEVDLLARFKSFKPLTIAGAGLTDGINPCAFTVIVFFISFLALQGYRRLELIVIGLSFILSVFVTYFLIGLGLFSFLYQLKGFWAITKILNIGVGLFSITLGVLAVIDFFRFKRTGSTEGLLLQLPQAVKNQIHSVIGAHYRKSEISSAAKPHIFRLLLSALITGFLVSLLEAVCTGQLYLPTITFVLKTTPLKLHALGFLFLYNLMFIVPLILIFMLAMLGVTSSLFAKFLKKHLLGIKLIMAFVFFALGIFLIWRA